MNFKLVLEELLTRFVESNIDYALMGGLALGAWGVVRATADIDFLVRREQLTQVDGIMVGLGYTCHHRSDNVSQYLSTEAARGAVDYLHAFRTATLEMLARAEDKEVFGGTMQLRVLRPEDIIGLKVQAMKNDPGRVARDGEDIRRVMTACADRMDWAEVEAYFDLFGMQTLFRQLRRGAEQ